MCACQCKLLTNVGKGTVQVTYTEFAKHHCNVFTSRKELNQGEGVCVCGGGGGGGGREVELKLQKIL